MKERRWERAGRKFTKEELKQLIDDLFDYYKQPVIYENEFKHYFKAFKGLTEEEINDLWIQGYSEGVIVAGVDKDPTTQQIQIVIWRPEDLQEPPPNEIEKILKEELKKKR